MSPTSMSSSWIRTPKVNDRKYEPPRPLGPILYALRRRRHEIGVGQASLAKRLGVSRRAMNNWETGRVPPNPKNLLNWAKVLAVDLDALDIDLLMRQQAQYEAERRSKLKDPCGPQRPSRQKRPDETDWTPEMDALLTAKWRRIRHHDLAAKLKISESALRRRAKVLNLASALSADMRQKWTDERRATLRELWPTTTLAEIARILEVTLDSVREQIRRMPDLPAKRPRGVARKKYTRKVVIDMPRPLAALEYAPGHYAVDERSYQIIQAVRAAA